MTLNEIENLSAADLKARRDELVAEAGKAPVKELAAQYVRARTDAKHRDEALADQAATIRALQDGMGAMQGKVASLEGQVSGLVVVRDELTAAIEAGQARYDTDTATLTAKFAAEKAAMVETATAEIEGLTKTVADTRTANTQLTESLVASKALAAARRAALADVMAFVGQLSSKVAPLLTAE